MNAGGSSCLWSAGPDRAAAMMPEAIAGAPNRMKHPTTVQAPRCQPMRPESIKNPTDAIAMTAIAVATVPSRVLCSQSAASVRGETDSVMLAKLPLGVVTRRIFLLSNSLQTPPADDHLRSHCRPTNASGISSSQTYSRRTAPVAPSCSAMTWPSGP